MMTPRDIIIRELTHPLPGYSVEIAEWHAGTILAALRAFGFAVVPREITDGIATAIDVTPCYDAPDPTTTTPRDYWAPVWRAAVEAAEKEIGT